MAVTSEPEITLFDYVAFRLVMLDHHPDHAPDDDVRRAADISRELRQRFREAGLHGHDLAVQLLLMHASERDRARRTILACTIAEIEATDRVSADGGFA